MKNLLLIIISFLIFSLNINAQLGETQSPKDFNLNKPEREEWLQDNGFGIFIHFSVDAQLGTVISHSLAGASSDYIERYMKELPERFYPKDYDAYQMGLIFKAAGARYVVFTAKHHSGFCMWDTETTDFNITNTPYGKDLLKEFVEGTRKAGLKVGFYYSPEDFIYSYKMGVEHINRSAKKQDYLPFKDDFKKYVEAQITELFTNYGQIDIFFNDGIVYGFANPKVWELQPNCLITRGAIPTPEQFVLSVPAPGAWESNLTMTDQWHYKPNDVTRKSAYRAIELLIETRAKGGAFLLNIGPRPDGLIDDPDYRNLVTLSGWNFVNNEGLFNTRPWIITNEGSIWFTRKKDADVLYAFLLNEKDWERGEQREFLLKSVKSTNNTRVSVLGMSGEVVEYKPELRGKAYPNFEQNEDGLHLSVMRAQRLYNNYKWPYPLVVKLENIEPALEPPVVETLEAERQDGEIILNGKLHEMGDANELKVGFEYRPYEGFIDDALTPDDQKVYMKTNTININKPGEFEIPMDNSGEGEWRFRAFIIHPKMRLNGNLKVLDISNNP